MPDTSAADIATIAGAFLAAVISGFGLRRGEAEKRGLPAAEERLSAGVFVGLDGETQRSILDELREMHADMAAWRRADEAERRARADRSVVERFEVLEQNQARILDLLRAADEHHGRR